MQKKAFLLLFLTFLLFGCSRQTQEETPRRLVTGVTVAYENAPIQFFRRYTSPEKMRQVLNYLRLIDPKGPALLEPEITGGGQYIITLLYSDGTNRVYRQKSDAYMQIDSGPWKQIDPDKAEWLSQLVAQMESDYD